MYFMTFLINRYPLPVEKCCRLTRKRKLNSLEKSWRYGTIREKKQNRILSSAFFFLLNIYIFYFLNCLYIFVTLRQRLHERDFISNRIVFDAVTPSVYTTPIETAAEIRSI